MTADRRQLTAEWASSLRQAQGRLFRLHPSSFILPLHPLLRPRN